jgi:hypothetical protein
MNNTLTQSNTYNTEQIRNPLLLAQHFANSGYFKDTSDVSKAVVKIVAGQELGFGPMASISGFHIVQGKPTISANLMGAAIKRSGRYNYRVVEMTPSNCIIDFFENGEHCGQSSFSLQDAKVAGTQNIQKFARNMLFARALSNGARWYCPDVLNGSPIYTPEELGAEVNENGEVINVVSQPAPKPVEVEYISPEQLQKLLKYTIPKRAEQLNCEVPKLINHLCQQFKAKTGLQELTKKQGMDLITLLEKTNLEFVPTVPPTTIDNMQPIGNGSQPDPVSDVQDIEVTDVETVEPKTKLQQYIEAATTLELLQKWESAIETEEEQLAYDLKFESFNQ